MKNVKIAVIGLGYVGLPLAVEFGKQYQTIAYDKSSKRIEECLCEYDFNGQVPNNQFKLAKNIVFTDDPRDVKCADYIIIAVPTPVDSSNQPDFSYLKSASAEVGRNMKPGSTIIYESTVYPGATEEICIPVLEAQSGYLWHGNLPAMVQKTDVKINVFYVGYSPERVNPGDKSRSLVDIVKVVSGDSDETLDRVSKIYSSIIKAGIYRAPSIRVAEAAKVIENTQRDLNIALMNELSIIFHKLNISTKEVLDAAKTKWNFMPFHPGLVGGHCIGVDPYYLTYKAEMLGYHPQVILAGRRINDSMAIYIAQQIIKKMIAVEMPIKGSVVSILGLTFKENCGDLRNSKVVDLVTEFREFGCKIFLNDPLADSSEVEKIFGMSSVEYDELPMSDLVVMAVPHDKYMRADVLNIIFEHTKVGGVIMDLRNCLDKKMIESRGYIHWTL